MADQRRVDVADLRSAGTQVDQEKVLFSAVHAETAAAVGAAQAGWVGSSAAALSEVTVRWHTVARIRTAAIGKHSGHMRPLRSTSTTPRTTTLRRWPRSALSRRTPPERPWRV